MKVLSKEMRITCFRDDRTIIELANGKIFDGNRSHLRSTSGAVLASPVGCELFALPATVDLRTLEDAELISLETAAKKLRKSLKEIQDTCRRFKIGTKFGDTKLLTQSHIEKLREKLVTDAKQLTTRIRPRKAATGKSRQRPEARAGRSK